MQDLLQACRSTKPYTAGPCVVNVYINYEKKFAFVEFRTVEETSNAMALDGIMFEGVSVRVRRPNDYNPAAAASLGPANPNAALNLTAIGLQVGSCLSKVGSCLSKCLLKFLSPAVLPVSGQTSTTWRPA